MLSTRNIQSKMRTAVLTIATLLAYTFAASPAMSQGEELFKTNCAVCHKTDDSRFVGPGLKGVTEKRSQEWLISWTKNSQALIASGDADAQAIYDEYGGAAMSSFEQLSDDEIISIFAYVDEVNAGGGETAVAPEAETSSSEASGAPVVEQQAPADGKTIIWVSIIVLILLIVWLLYGTLRGAYKALDENGYLDYHNYRKNYFITFFAILLCAAIVVYLLKEGFSANDSTFNGLMFGALPYVALAMFFVGTVFRYLNIGFKVSSLSSQFLEGRQLFFGSQPFHWGMLVLFFGHLIAFAVPKAVILWNGHPVRLLILEVSSLVFAISALVGLILLMKRRFTNRRVSVVTNNMDTFVYVILLVQILSGIAIALFARWGSTWFAASLTPYLRSIFTFSPEVEVAGAMPWFVQIHIVSAFVIVAMIPFTRFVHFLVAPIHYIWRKYQVVYWNWNRKTIRKSTNHTYGKSPRNH